jgi:flagellar secretion chaperone FliS
LIDGARDASKDQSKGDLPVSTQGLQQYQTGAVQTASPGQLVVMLYDGFLRFAAQAQDALERDDIGSAAVPLTKAQAIITELRVSLDMSQGVIASNLASLYIYVTERLSEGRIKKDPSQIVEARKVMADLREAWVKIAATPKPVSTAPRVGVNLAG